MNSTSSKGFLIDLDGTMYHGKHMIPGADDLIREFRLRNIPYLFVTNNSSKTPINVASHLNAMGIPAEAEDVCTSSLAAAKYIAGESPGARVAMLGEDGLREALKEAGLQWVEESPDYVVQGIDRSLTYESLTKAVSWIRGGAKYVLTNPDLLLPSDQDLIPGAGSIAASIQAAAGVEPIVIGKPSSHLMNFAMEKLGLDPSDTSVIGDNMMTDIAAGSAAGCHTILVLTGLTTRENIDMHMKSAGLKPDMVCEDLARLKDLLCP